MIASRGCKEKAASVEALVWDLSKLGQGYVPARAVPHHPPKHQER